MYISTACVPNHYTKTALSATNCLTALGNRKDFKGYNDRIKNSLTKEQNGKVKYVRSTANSLGKRTLRICTLISILGDSDAGRSRDHLGKQ